MLTSHAMFSMAQKVANCRVAARLVGSSLATGRAITFGPDFGPLTLGG